MLTKNPATKNKIKPYTVASFTLMSSEHKLLLLANSSIIEIDATNIRATSSITEAESESESESETESETVSKYNKHCQQKTQYNCSSANRQSTSSTRTKSRRHHRHHRHYCTCDTNGGAVKPHSTVLTNHLVNSLMTLLYFIAFVSLSTYPVYVSAVAPKYETAYACEEKTLTIGCESGYLINLIRANYGRFSITICNDHGNVDWSVNCMSAKSLRVLYSKCSHKQNCSVLASTNMFGDPCAGTHKYLEAHYQCVSESQTTSTTARPSPPWLRTSQPSVWGTSTIRNPTTSRISLSELESMSTIGGGSNVVNKSVSNNSSNKSSSNNDSLNNKTYSISNTGNRKTVTKLKTTGTKNAATAGAAAAATTFTTTESQNASAIDNGSRDDGSSGASQNSNSNRNNENASVAAVTKSTNSGNGSAAPSSSSTTSRNAADQSNAGGGLLESKQIHSSATQSTVSSINSGTAGTYEDALYCGPTTARNLFWNFTRVGDINVQPCPGGATGIAKWRCAQSDRAMAAEAIVSNKNKNRYMSDDDETNGGRVVWQPTTPDLTQCRSLWLNSLEVRVQQRESSVVSIANELSQVTNSKTLYGGDMLVTTKIIQMMSEKMTYDIETYPDQKQREGIVSELLNGVVKTGSNLLDETQHLSWLDLSFEDQMRVATALLTGLEDGAFLLAATIARERNVVQKVKNILISVRVLETRNIVGNEIFPDANIEQWQVSEDSIELPRGALIENSEGGLVRIVFVAFDRLESILRPLDTAAADQRQYGSADTMYGASINTSHGQPAQPSRVRILNSKVISASLGKGRHIQLSQPIRLVLKHLVVDNVTNPSCVFWNYIDHAWSEDGCRIDQTNRTHTICMCNHLTNFAILMDVIDDTAQFIQQIGVFDENIRLLISISIAICIIFIIIALLTLKLFNGIFVKSNRTTIYKNLYICLLVTEVLIWLGNIQNESSMLCGFTTAFLHCAFLCTISWMFLEGYQSYIILTTEEILLEVENSSRIISYYLVTYGLSFTIVAISLGIDPSTYTIKADACVWMEQNYLFYVTFVLPCCIYISANLIYVAFSTYILCKKYKTSLKNKEHTRLANIRFYLRSSFIFQLIFVGCWLFAYLYMVNLHSIYDSIGMATYTFNGDSTKANIVMYGYGFVILNIVQGTFILTFHCLQNEKIRHAYRKFILQHSWLPQCLLCGTGMADGDQRPNPSTGSTANNILTGGSPHHIGGSFLSASTQSSTNPNLTNSAVGQPPMTSTLMRHQTLQSQRHHNAHGAYSTGTLRDNRSSQQISPSSSMTNAEGHKLHHQYDLQKPELIYPHSGQSSQQFHQLHDDVQQHGKMHYFDRKIGGNSKTLKSQQMMSSPARHDYPYFTGTTDGYKHNKSNRHNDNSPNSISKYPNSGSNAELLQSQKPIPNYPSFKKKIMHYAQSSSTPAQTKSPSHRDTFGPDDDVPAATMQFSGRDFNTNRHSWISGGGGAGVAYNHHQKQMPMSYVGAGPNSSYATEEPVYEEIMSNRVFDMEDGEDNMNRRRNKRPRPYDVHGEYDDKKRYGYGNSDNATRDNCDADDGEDDEDDDEIDRLCLNDNDDLIQPYFRKPSGFAMGAGQMGIEAAGFSDAHQNKSALTNKNIVLQQQQQQQLPNQLSKNSQQIGRNISAMLNENNTVVCYLEPLPNS